LTNAITAHILARGHREQRKAYLAKAPSEARFFGPACGRGVCGECRGTNSRRLCVRRARHRRLPERGARHRAVFPAYRPAGARPWGPTLHSIGCARLRSPARPVWIAGILRATGRGRSAPGYSGASRPTTTAGAGRDPLFRRALRAPRGRNLYTVSVGVDPESTSASGIEARRSPLRLDRRGGRVARNRSLEYRPGAAPRPGEAQRVLMSHRGIRLARPTSAPFPPVLSAP
jgi:hypothetical protein